MTDVISETALRASLGEDAPPIVRVSERIDSTNNAAKRAFCNGVHSAALFAAEEQTAGRGRMGRAFHSPRGSGVYFSIFQPLDAPPQTVLHRTCAAGVAVRRGILSATGRDTEIKWVNDLRLGSRKVCGILAEALSMGDCHGIVIGVGINLRPTAFPEDLAEVAGSLNDVACSRADLIAACVRELLKEDGTAGDWLADYRAHSCTLGRFVRILRDGNEIACGVAEDVRADGALLLRQADGTLLPICSGEVSIRA